MDKIIIAIDGFSSCGKSTLAKQLATELQYIFVDTGAMYRAITLYFLINEVNINDDIAIEEALSKIKLHFEYVLQSNKSHIFLNNKDVETEIRGMEVSNHVSIIAALHQVRTFAVAQQQAMGLSKGIVMDGRDIGTTVFPGAELKIFVTANEEIRVDRRFKELSLTNSDISRAEIQNNLKERDFIDSTRKVSPLKQADDAIVLDNSSITREEQLAIVLEWVKKIKAL